MSQLFRAVVLVAAIGAVLAAGNMVTTTAPAQEKKSKVAKEDVGVTEIYKAKDGWRFRVKNNEGKSVAIGTRGFDKKEDAEDMVDFVKTTLSKGKVNVLKEEKK